MASFLAEVKDKYNSLLTTNGIITVEMLKAVLKDKDTTGRFLLNFGDTIVEWYRTSKPDNLSAQADMAEEPESLCPFVG